MRGMAAKLITQLVETDRQELHFVSAVAKAAVYQLDDEQSYVSEASAEVTWSLVLEVEGYGLKSLSPSLEAVHVDWRLKHQDSSPQAGKMTWTPELPDWTAEAEFHEVGTSNHPPSLLPLAVAVYAIDRRVVVTF